MICQLVLEYFQLQLSDILFFSGGLRPFWDFLAFERPDGLSQAKKSQKGLRPPEKTKCLQASAENTPKKVDSSWKNACFLFIFGPISYWRAFFHDTIHFCARFTLFTLLIFLENWVFAFSELGFCIFRTEFMENNWVLAKFAALGFKKPVQKHKNMLMHICFF